MLCLHAIHLMRSVLAGTETKKLQDVLEAAFGTEEKETEEGPFEEEQETEASTSLGTKRKIPQPEGSSKRKASQPTKTGVCALSDAAIYYPTTADAAASYLHAGVDSAFFSSCISSQKMKSAGYECMYSAVKKSEGIDVPDCSFFSTTKGQLSTHIHQFHLGVAIACFICPSKRWWSSSSWMDHMKKFHAELDPKSFFIQEGVDIEEFKSSLAIKQEVTGDDI